jgi:hypothetical protein
MMPSREVELDEYAVGQAAADGTCVVQLGPIRRQVWQVTNEAVTCTSPLPDSTATPTARLYNGPSVAGQLLAGTYDGSNDSAGVSVKLAQNGRITCVWEGADPGSTCTLSIYGTMLVPA